MRITDALRLLYGSVLLVHPAALVGREAGAPTDLRPVVRVLGARHVAQALASGRWPNATMRHVGAALDALHAVTDLGYATIDRGRALPASADAAVAVALGAANLRLAAGAARADQAAV